MSPARKIGALALTGAALFGGFKAGQVMETRKQAQISAVQEQQRQEALQRQKLKKEGEVRAAYLEKMRASPSAYVAQLPHLNETQRAALLNAAKRAGKHPVVLVKTFQNNSLADLASYTPREKGTWGEPTQAQQLRAIYEATRTSEHAISAAKAIRAKSTSFEPHVQIYEKGMPYPRK